MAEEITLQEITEVKYKSKHTIIIGPGNSYKTLFAKQLIQNKYYASDLMIVFTAHPYEYEWVNPLFVYDSIKDKVVSAPLYGEHLVVFDGINPTDQSLSLCKNSIIIARSFNKKKEPRALPINLPDVYDIFVILNFKGYERYVKKITNDYDEFKQILEVCQQYRGIFLRIDNIEEEGRRTYMKVKLN